MNWLSIIRILSAALFLTVAFYPSSADPVVPPELDPVIDVDSSAALVLTDTGSGSSVSTPDFFDSMVQDALKDNGYSWKRFDDSVDIDSQKYLDLHWKKAYKKAIEDSSGSRPWLLIGNSEGGESIPLPGSAEAIVELVNKYGGGE